MAITASATAVAGDVTCNELNDAENGASVVTKAIGDMGMMDSARFAKKFSDLDNNAKAEVVAKAGSLYLVKGGVAPLHAVLKVAIK
ncbi:hypothetical protein ACQKP8_26335 [Photobacterium alginatilyticum]|uniref:hypothetical protein n=1 Tax=Photobacterium alginatilyticum TaxID=1775171 RepID=UPI0040681A57